MKSEKIINQNRYQLTGWVLFVLSALFFIASSFQSGDMIGLTGGLLFLIACFVFLIPLIASIRTAATSSSEPQAAGIDPTSRN